MTGIHLELPFREEQDLRAGAVLEATVHTGSGTTCPQDGDLVRTAAGAVAGERPGEVAAGCL